ncbi:hypothetical protein DFP72DRAFT_851162 [Ephemerocybe angulata]|uniref:Uncharacterized protein n=1 Tax=Ephemerocybe angulata TaxID=980116 RepID=A0A8H6HQB9_9AGAR|nr:hypothetical protein DFP72DRAFT_851162 [Tulosesus angulatus]
MKTRRRLVRRLMEGRCLLLWKALIFSSSMTVSLLKRPPRLRKLRQAMDEDLIDILREYETRLHCQIENVNRELEWTKKANKHDLDLLSENLDDEHEDDNDLPSSNGNIYRYAENGGGQAG